ncbi:uncharacterized protein BDW47DRAFT_111733 [Aspergillus candidus]|uniref:Uncharacterized protein n=1 Tax=Aspergillus candidus TaxID=41067 RepID=A0A2I2F241_ASPCN|nr:hypothetical protein BDW47DRAFT_111733 [Aspergillus candidus]PLB34705.1 hypothetical protein BDW47DRAFT_111733 [Aspergillus candidus]
MNAMAEVGGVTHAAHARAALVDLVDPVIDLVVGLDLTGDALRGHIAGQDGGLGPGVFGIGQADDLERHAGIFRPRDAGDGGERDGENDLAGLIFGKIQAEFAQGQKSLVPRGEKLVFLAPDEALLDDREAALAGLVGFDLSERGGASIGEQGQVRGPRGRG